MCVEKNYKYEVWLSLMKSHKKLFVISNFDGILIALYESKQQHALQQLQKFHISEVDKKWLPWMKAIPPWSPSAWPFAKHWPARARPSASPLSLALTSPSLWTPGARKSTVWGPRRGKAPQHSAEMQGAGKNLPKRSKPLQLRPSLMMENLL